jgi:hypothetical protein
MSLDPMQNKYLILGRSVIRTPATDPIIARLDPYFGAADHQAFITSVLRDPAAQLRLIQDFCRVKNIAKDYCEVLTATIGGMMQWNGRSVYEWQPGWSRLLNIGLIVSPPRPAEALLDYFKDGINKKGLIIPASEHFLGTAFDISGRGGLNPTIEDEIKVVKTAMTTDPNLGIRNYTIERNNNCLHISCEAAS